MGDVRCSSPKCMGDDDRVVTGGNTSCVCEGTRRDRIIQSPGSSLASLEPELALPN
jgi:hypothetical protein